MSNNDPPLIPEGGWTADEQARFRAFSEQMDETYRRWQAHPPTPEEMRRHLEWMLEQLNSNGTLWMMRLSEEQERPQ